MMHHHPYISDGAPIISAIFFLAAALLTGYTHGSDH
jgi:hypothetical protein